MNILQELINEIEEHHSFEICSDPSEIKAVEDKYGNLPSDLVSFYYRYRTVSLYDGPFGPSYRFVPPSEIHPTWIDIYGDATDNKGPETWLTICDVSDGNYVAMDIASGRGDEYNFIDCFHETFAEPGESKIVSKSFSELLQCALRGGGDKLFWLDEDFVGYGDGMPLTAENASIRIEGPEVTDSGWLMRFRHKDKYHREFFSDRKYGGNEKSFIAIEDYIEETTK